MPRTMVYRIAKTWTGHFCVIASRRKSRVARHCCTTPAMRS